AMGPSDDKSPVQSVQELLGVIRTGLGTALDLKSLFGLGVVGLAAATARHNQSVRPVVRLYDRLLEEAGPLVGARVKMTTDPYRALHQQKALILQGRNKEGKTTLLCTALPWYHRRGPWAYYGLYFNGGHGKAVSNFEKWHTVQLFGNLNMGGSAREGKARVIFVVNSDAGAQTLLNLNQGPRFTKLSMEPPSGEGADLDQDLFGKCGRNIGLYKQVLAEIDRGAIEKGKEETFIEEQVQRWERDFHIPYPLKYDRSWSRLATKKSLPLMKQTLGQALEQVLLAQK
ncbi:unnamed protein product, partial [Symbiodinium necroappetens]